MSSVEAALASLRVWAVEVDVRGRTFRVPPRPASDWFIAVLSGDDWPIVPGMFEPEDEEAFLDMVMAEDVRDAEVKRANRDALASASGWRWWEAERLIVSAAVEWKIVGGLLQGAGVDVDRLSLGAVLSAMYAMCVTNMKMEDRIKFDMQLSAPPVGYDGEDPAEWFASTGAAASFADLVRSASADQGG